MIRRLVFLILLTIGVAHAQNPAVHQSGNVTPNHGVKWIANGVIGDSGGGVVSLSGTAVPNQLALWLSSGLLTGYFAQPGLPLIGAASNGTITQGTVSGTTTEFGTVSGTLTPGDCLKVGTGGNIVDLGSSCNTGAVAVPTFQIFASPGTVSSVTLTQTPLPVNASLVQVSVDGIVQARSTWSLNLTSGVLTFNNAVTYINTIEVDWWSNSSMFAGVSSITVGGVTYSGSVTLPVTGNNGGSIVQVYNPAQPPYSADPTGVRDSTAAWQAMCAAAKATGGTIQPTPGTYRVFTSLLVTPNETACLLGNVNGLTFNFAGVNIVSDYSAVVLISGTATNNDVLHWQFTSISSAWTSQTVTVTVTTGESTTSMATAWAAAINANTTLSGQGIGAASVGNRVYITGTTPVSGNWIVGNLQGINFPGVWVTGAKTETLTLVQTDFIECFPNCQNITINDLTGTANSGFADAGTGGSVNWFAASAGGGPGYGVRGLHVHNANLNGGEEGVAIIRVLGTSQWSENIFVDGQFSNMGYPVSDQGDGLNTVATYTTSNIARSYIGYNVNNVKLNINSTTSAATLQDVEIGVFYFPSDISFSTTANIDVTYTNINSVAYGNSFFILSHQTADGNTAGQTFINNIKFHPMIVIQNTPDTNILFNENTMASDPGNVEESISMDGYIGGSVSNSTPACFFSETAGSCNGFTGSSAGSIDLHDLFMPSIQWATGNGADMTFQNYNGESVASPAIDAASTPNITYVPPVRWSNDTVLPVASSTGQTCTIDHGAIKSCP